MRTLYSAQFQVCPLSDTTNKNLFWLVLSEFNSWITNKYSEQRGIETSIPSNGNTIQPSPGHYLYGDHKSKDFNDGRAELFRLRWQHPSDNDATMTWTTDATIASFGPSVEVYLTIKLSSAKNVLSPSRVNVGRPGVITNILRKFPTKLGEYPIPLRYEIIDANKVKDFISNRLEDHNRVLPVVLLSPNETGLHHVKPKQMRNWLLGFAHVAALKDQKATEAWTAAMGSQMACYNGAIRVYWPNWKPCDPGRNHKLYLPWNLPEDHAEAPKIIFGLLARISSFRLKEGKAVTDVRTLFRLDEKKKNDELKKQLEAYKGKAAQTDDKEHEELLEDFEKTLQQNDFLTDEVERLTEELTTVKDNFEALCRAKGTSNSSIAECGLPEEPREFKTVLEALEAASEDFKNNLFFLDSASNSAAESPFIRPEEVYQHLEALNNITAEWKEKGGILGRGWQDWFDEHGIANYRAHVSQTAKGKYENDYKFIYKGERKFFESHFTIGSGDPNKCLSIHWYKDEENLTVVIGHCGKHLRNTLS